MKFNVHKYKWLDSFLVFGTDLLLQKNDKKKRSTRVKEMDESCYVNVRGHEGKITRHKTVVNITYPAGGH